MLLQAALEESSLTTIVLAIIGLVGTGGAVKLADIYIKYAKDKKVEDNKDSVAFRDSLQDKVKELEEKIDSFLVKIEEIIINHSDEMLEISTAKAKLEVEVKHLKSDNKELEAEVKALRT